MEASPNIGFQQQINTKGVGTIQKEQWLKIYSRDSTNKQNPT